MAGWLCVRAVGMIDLGHSATSSSCYGRVHQSASLGLRSDPPLRLSTSLAVAEDADCTSASACHLPSRCYCLSLRHGRCTHLHPSLSSLLTAKMGCSGCTNAVKYGRGTLLTYAGRSGCALGSRKRDCCRDCCFSARRCYWSPNCFNLVT